MLTRFFEHFYTRTTVNALRWSVDVGYMYYLYTINYTALSSVTIAVGQCVHDAH